MKLIPYNRPYVNENTVNYLKEVMLSRHYSGGGQFTKLCESWISDRTKPYKGYLTNSCTAALEIAAIALDGEIGDEIIMPSYTFVSTANAFVLNGYVPVFVDIRQDTLNIDENKIESAITTRTKAIVCVHYAGVACEMEKILFIARKYGLLVIEDAAQGFMSKYETSLLGCIGDIGAYSFHDTKNITAGEGGCILAKNKDLIEKIEVIKEKGTNRKQLLNGEVDKYTWVSKGSSYVMPELSAALLLSQLENAEMITSRRIELWNNYHQLIKPLEEKGYLKRPALNLKNQHNAHIYFIILENNLNRNNILIEMKRMNVLASFHYIPLHLSKVTKKYYKVNDDLSITERVADQLIRLPLWHEITVDEQLEVVKVLTIAIANEIS
jgi:dTDP-4-amino-4,6-dideoxygalactose transaminase